MKAPFLCAAAAAFAIALALPFSASADLEADDCRAQFTDPEASRIACVVTYEPSEETVTSVLSAGAPGPELEQLGALIKTTKCETTVDADKAEVTASWFTADKIAIPSSPVSCTMTDESGAELAVSTMAKVDCDRPGGEWTCAAVISETTGLSFMGAVLESMVNGNEGVGERLEAFVTDLAKSLGVTS